MPALSLNASKKTKQTPAGEIPVDWGCVKLSRLLKLKSGSTKPADTTPLKSDESQTPVIGGNGVMGFSSQSNSKRPTIAIGRVGEKCGCVHGVNAEAWITDNALYASSISEEVSREYALIELESLNLNRFRNKGGQPLISQSTILSIPIPLPPLPEQRKIADILATWDRALETLDQLIAAKTRRKQALMQQLLTGKKRLPGFSGEWQSQRFSDFLKESRIPGSNGSTAKKLTVKLYGKGVFAKDEKRIGSANTKYYTRRAGQFIYSKLDFLNGAFGIIPKDLDGYESTLDLPAFEVSEKADIRWLLALVSRPHFYSTKVGAAAGGRKARRINPPEFLSMKIDAPGKAEQTAIAQVLDTADHELRLLKQQRTALEQQKRGLMQQLLTGKVRVKP